MRTLSSLIIAGTLVFGMGAVEAKPASDLKTKSGTSAKLTLNDTDREFLQELGRMRLGEVETSRLATRKAKSAEVKGVAKEILAYHDRIDPRLRTIATRAGVVLPSKVDPERQKFIAELRKKSGKDFDNSYLEGQKSDHKQSVELFEKVAKTGHDQDLQAFVTERSSEAETMQKKVDAVATKQGT